LVGLFNILVILISGGFCWSWRSTSRPRTIVYKNDLFVNVFVSLLLHICSKLGAVAQLRPSAVVLNGKPSKLRSARPSLRVGASRGGTHQGKQPGQRAAACRWSRVCGSAPTLWRREYRVRPPCSLRCWESGTKRGLTVVGSPSSRALFGQVGQERASASGWDALGPDPTPAPGLFHSR
jgi:hypothetical protein